MIRYPEFVEKGWQIGSGPTEATCKTLTARLKGSGMRWDADNAEALMALEALTQSGQWEVVLANPATANGLSTPGSLAATWPGTWTTWESLLEEQGNRAEAR